MSSEATHHPGSFRDPAGFIFSIDSVLYRQINHCFREQFDFFENSGACHEFITKGWLIPHEKIAENLTDDAQASLFLKPLPIPFISYPYEWSFDMLRDAALLTLELATASLEKGLQLKDASPYNIQFLKGKPIFIDTLSFEKYQPGPWIAYRQFCESFLAPLLIMHYAKKQMPELMKAWPDGVPLPVAVRLLPWRSRFSVHVYLHLHLQARLSQKKKINNARPANFSLNQLKRVLLSLQTLVKGLKLSPLLTTWSDYYEEAGQRGDYLEEKKKLIANWLNQSTEINSVIDLGANEGLFSQLVAARNIPVLAADIDPECINRLYQQIRASGQTDIQPLVQDLAQPSPGIGVNNVERASFSQRARADLAIALALIHHLALQKKMSFAMIRDFLYPIAPQLIIEFVPPEDEKASLLLQRIEGIKPLYNQQEFEDSFLQKYQIHQKTKVISSERILYWLIRK